MQRTVLRGAPLVAQPQPARLRCRPVAGCGVRCGAGTQERLGAAQVKKVAVDGTPKGEVTLALHTAKESVAVGLVHRYLTLVRQNARRGTASTLTRAEVRGGGRKPFKQKGTGQARRGSRRSPLVVGGGVTFGPKPRDWSIKMNKKERRLAMATALQTAAGSMTVVDDLTATSWPERKTKAMALALAKWGVGPEEHALLVTTDLVDTVEGSARNLGKCVHATVKGLNIYDVLRADKIIIEEGALNHLAGWFGAEGAAWA